MTEPFDIPQQPNPCAPLVTRREQEPPSPWTASSLENYASEDRRHAVIHSTLTYAPSLSESSTKRIEIRCWFSPIETRPMRLGHNLWESLGNETVSVSRTANDLILANDSSAYPSFPFMHATRRLLARLDRSNRFEEKEPDANSSEITGQFGSQSLFTLRGQHNRTSRSSGISRSISRHKSLVNRAWSTVNKVTRKGIIESANQP